MESLRYYCQLRCKLSNITFAANIASKIECSRRYVIFTSDQTTNGDMSNIIDYIHIKRVFMFDP